MFAALARRTEASVRFVEEGAGERRILTTTRIIYLKLLWFSVGEFWDRKIIQLAARRERRVLFRKMAVFRYMAFLVLGSAFVMLLSTIVMQNYRPSAEPELMLATFADRWNDFKTSR